MSEQEKGTVTVLLVGGQCPLDIMGVAYDLAKRYSLKVYFSNAQNLRLIDIPLEAMEEVQNSLVALGANLKAKGKFPVPRVCEGRDNCKLGTFDTNALSYKIVERFGSRSHTKAKFKIAVSGCILCCSNAKSTDIGIVGTRSGFDIYAGGKGGQSPKVGIRIQRDIDEDKVLDVMETLVNFHDAKTGKKQRIYKLLTDPEFPYSEV